MAFATLAGLFGAFAFAQDPRPGELEVYDAVPAEPSIVVRAGERREFALWVAGEAVQYQWLLDGGHVGTRRSWVFTPGDIDLGGHLVTGVADAGGARTTRTWRVQVVASDAVVPSTVTTSSAPDAATSTSSTSTVAPATTVPVPTTSSTSARPTTTSTVRATTTTTARPTTTIRPTTTTTARPTTTSTVRPTTSSTVRATTSTTERATTTTTERPTPTTLPPSQTGAVTEGDVRSLLERYKAAWRNHDVKGLEAVGQITTPGQADALASYFESVNDLDVEVTILGIETSGGDATVRFVRRDRFRDPGGSLVVKESPPIEKRVVRTPGGLKLAPLR